jgi:putative MATE family efflux protein
MNQKSYLKEFIRYTAFNILGMLGLSCYILADTFFVARGLGANGLAALNLALPVYSVINGTGLMLGMGGATKYSIFRGQKNYEAANRIFSNTLAAALFFAALYMGVGLAFSGKIAALLGADAAVHGMTDIYLKVVLLFSPAFIINNILNCFVRNDGNPNLGMAAMLTGSFSNIIMDYIFIFPLGMGMLGAVLATGFAPVIGIIILSRHFRSKKSSIRLSVARPNARLTGETLILGIPSLVTELSSGIVIIIFNMIILNLRGNVGVAAYGVIANISLVVVSIFTGISQGMQPLLSRAYGENDTRNIPQILRYALVTAGGAALLLYGIMFLFASPITTVFNSEGNPALQKMAVEGIKLYFLAVPFAGMNVVLSVYFTSTDKPLPAHIISLLRGLLLIVPMTFLLAALFELTGVWLAFPVTEAVVSMVAAVLYRKLRT